MKITITNIVSTTKISFDKEDDFKSMIKAIDNCLEDYSKFITYNGKSGVLKFSSDYLRNSLIEIND